LTADLLTKLESIQRGVSLLLPELILSGGILLVTLIGLLNRNKNRDAAAWLTLSVFVLSMVHTMLHWPVTPISIFESMLRTDDFAAYFKLLFDIAGSITVLMSLRHEDIKTTPFNAEYFTFLMAAVLGAHLLAMSTNLLMVFLSMELLSISAYILAGYSADKKGAEGSLKYFLFGSVASAVMLYGFSILYGFTGTLDFTSGDFAEQIISNQTPLLLVAGLMSFAGFLYKIAAAPMHPWAPDVYEAAPMPVLAFLSTAPKLAGVAILAKFTLSLNIGESSPYDWQVILSVLAIVTITVGNFSALWQTNAKRMMAYSSIAQSGFLLIGLLCFTTQGIQFMLFYASVYLLMNFSVFICLQVFEKNGVTAIHLFTGWGKSQVLVSIILIIGFIGLAGIPPTAGFTSKLFLFTALWDAYEQTGKDTLLWLLVFGLLNTVVALFYYLKIPYYAFIKRSDIPVAPVKTQAENLLALLLVLAIVFLFIHPGLLMGWLNRINFVL
jgi:NADH-quinone oxidoreductase subunit N